MLWKTTLMALCVGVGMSNAAYAGPISPEGAMVVASTTQAQASKVNLNKASAAELAQALTGVGQRRAEAIVALREQLGGFTELNQLMQIKGIGPRLLELNKQRMEL
ncbi:hypothetical protein CWI80_00305 [Pseudidiomarina sediminum]|uniref:Competence protein ComEA n=1 Tax=Pseudidiomarina sediminum TaxID=431675 RepID=A0A432Z7N1_9GAMM|nr:helix-hairpin-helix domain-containing protein [Pseudidiomarina sediminum]MBY6062990.1 helix-hairpin-helix domain-containing protein [Pseudidiomarina sediminum]RUO73845.1 hypothetical protein CWI80_00305 [Pseudidiomarina sediminum]